jgi:cytochrome c553
MEHLSVPRPPVLIAVLTLFASAACAEPSSLVAYDSATLRLLATADPVRGEELAGKCSKCHGEKGVSDDPVDINIAGLRASYIYKQLRDYKDGKRVSKEMIRRVRVLDDQQMADLAVWFASLEPAQPAPDRNADPEILQLIRDGDPQRMIKACNSCHGPDNRGGQFDNPSLVGQHAEYVVTTLTEFRDGDRTNDIYSRMRTIAEVLSDAEIEALAAYFAPALPQETP